MKEDYFTRIAYDKIKTQPAKTSEANSVKNNVSLIEDMIENANILLKNYKRDIIMLKQDIQIMKESSIKTIEQTQSTILPFIHADSQKLEGLINQQQHENNNLQKQLVELHDEKVSIEGYINSDQTRIALLETQVGD